MMAAFIAAEAGDRTKAIQQAIDHVTAEGPGMVTLGAGEHAVRGLRLASHLTLNLAAGAVLRFSTDYADYADNQVGAIAEDSDRACIVARGLHNLRITGAGTIDGQGQAWAKGFDPVMGTLIPMQFRPRMIVIETCTDVVIEGITLTQSPMWTLHLLASQNITVRQMTVDNDRRMPNTDGIVVDGCQHVRITECSISTADDGVVLKTSRWNGDGIVPPAHDIHVSHCRVESHSCALKLGTESHGDISHVVFEDCEIVGSNRALGLFSRDGGVMENIRFSRIRLDSAETPDGFWGSGEALTVTLLDRRPDERLAGDIRNVLVEDVQGVMEGAVNLVGCEPGRITNLTLRNVSLRQKPGSLGTGQKFDMRPGPADLVVSADAHGRANAWVRGADGHIIGLYAYPGGMPGVYARNIAGLQLDGVEIDRPEILPAGWHPQAIVIEG